MGFFDFRIGPDINQGVKTFGSTEGAVLLDVRTPEEYRQGHIPGSCNIPLQTLGDVAAQIPDRDTPLFVYCRSGNRSAQAASLLKGMGYANVTDIGGITAYTGRVER